MTFRVPESSRIRLGAMASSPLDGCNGAFVLRSPIPGRRVFAIASDGMGWEHVSVTVQDGAKKRMPTWEEMSHVKGVFWEDEDVVVQFHPAKSQHVNFHPTCLHLWRRSGQNLETPPVETIGPRSAVS